jgi:L-seryl-tRNA(Ser) seleniumtransferase
VGFSEQPSLDSLAKLAHRHRLPVLEDLGSGCVVDLPAAGIQDEPTVQACLKAGVDITTFSGDKLLGGPQSGIIIGRKKYLELIRENPLYRALRVDKLTLAALEATLLSYLRRDEKKSIPSLRMIFASKQEIADRARGLVRRVESLFSTNAHISLEVVDGVSVIGGGSTPGQEIRTALIAITSKTRSAQSIEKHFRMQTIPILVRVESKQVLVDLRTVLPEEEEMLFRALSALIEATK